MWTDTERPERQAAANDAAGAMSLPLVDDVPRTLEQVAEALGAPYTVNTLRAAADRGDLVTYRVVGTALFTDRRFVEDWIERCRARTSGTRGDDRSEGAGPAHASSATADAGAATAAAEDVASRLTGGGRRTQTARPRPMGRTIRPVSS